MFGHQSNDDNANADHVSSPAVDAALGPQEPSTFSPTAGTPPVTAPPVDDPAVNYVMTDLPHSSAPGTPPVTATPSVADSSAASDTKTAGAQGGEDLIELKQSALHELSPLIGHLEQTPEEKFRTTMMMIQASDDASMLPTAFEAAKQIKDEKARAQALLDVVNEINYFTQQHNDAE